MTPPSTSSVPRANRRLLLVDDDRVEIRWMRIVLKGAGYTDLIQVNSGEDALIALQEHPDVAVLITDVVLSNRAESGLNGIALAQKARTIVDQIQVVICSQHSEMTYPIEALRLGAVDYLTKPIDANQLLSAVDRALALYDGKSNIEGAGAKIFLSYAREDLAEVLRLRLRLQRVGYRPWIDVFDICGGERWFDAIQDAIRSSHLFIACISSNSVSKRGVLQRELRLALETRDGLLDRDIFLLPLRLDETELPQSLQNVQWIDYSNPSAGWQRLCEAIEEGMRRRGEA